MEIFGSFMMITSIIGFFLAVIWFILPFVIFSIKGRVDRLLVIAEEANLKLLEMEKRLAGLEASKQSLSTEEEILPEI